jgi:hypothetical protein
MMCMKINEVSSSRWSKTEVGGPQRPRWFYPLGRLNFPVESRVHIGVALLPEGGTDNSSGVEAEGETSRGGTSNL